MGALAGRIDMAAKRHLMIRGVALIVLLMAAYVAWTRNFGEGIKGVPVLAVLSAAISFSLEWIDHSQSERMKKVLTHSMLSLPFLVTGYVVMLVVLSLNAPVTVLSSGDQVLPVNLTAVDTTDSRPVSATSAKGEPARFHTWSTPLGRPFRLKVKGYTAKTLDVSAPAGVMVSTERDLVPQLVVLIRPTLDGMFELRSGGSIHVYSKKQNQENEIAHAQPKTASSVLLGAAPVPIPHDMIEDWRLELAGRRMPDTARANVLRAWKMPAVAVLDASADELAPHQMLRIELRNQANEPIQCGTMELPESLGTIVDFPLEACRPSSNAAATPHLKSDVKHE
jgi:hypothetical protein